MKVLLLLAQGCEEIEAVTLIDILRRGGITVVSAGLNAQPVLASRGVQLLADTTLELAQHLHFDMIVLPGGQPGADNLNADMRVRELIKICSQKGKLVGAICAAPIVLAGAGVLNGKHITSYPTYRDRFSGVVYEEKTIVEDGNVLTSRGPGTALNFGLAIVERLAGKEKARQIKEAMLIS